MHSSIKQVKVLILDPVPAEAIQLFREEKFKIDAVSKRLSEAELADKIGEYQFICLSKRNDDSGVYLTGEVLRRAHKLLAIGWFSRECEGVDLSTAQEMGIPVFTAPYQHQHSVAELVISFIILLARQTGDRSMEIHRGDWQKKSDGCVEVRAKTLGIIGYGHVGSQIGILAESLGMRVTFYDREEHMPIGRAERKASLDDLLCEADFVSLSVSELPENDKMLGAEQFAAMKRRSFVINASYCNAVDLDALADAISSGHIAGAALDSFPDQAKSARSGIFKHRLQELTNVILTPSIGDYTAETTARIGYEVASAIVRFNVDGSTIGAANFPSVGAWPLKPNCRRIVNMHRNVRGFLKEIDNILAAYNVGKQVLETRDKIGYLIADINASEVTTEIVSQLALLSNTIRTRIL